MWLNDDVIDLLKNNIPYYFIVAIPIFMIISPVTVEAAAEFSVFRLQQYDLHGISHGKYAFLLYFSLIFLKEGFSF